MLVSKGWKLLRNRSGESTIDERQRANEWNHIKRVLLDEPDNQREKLSVLRSNSADKLRIRAGLETHLMSQWHEHLQRAFGQKGLHNGFHRLSECESHGKKGNSSSKFSNHKLTKE